MTAKEKTKKFFFLFLSGAQQRRAETIALAFTLALALTLTLALALAVKFECVLSHESIWPKKTLDFLKNGLDIWEICVIVLIA